MEAPADNAVERPSWGHHACRTCSRQRMPSGHDKAVQESGQPKCSTKVFTGVPSRAAVPSHVLNRAVQD